MRFVHSDRIHAVETRRDRMNAVTTNEWAFSI
jgi:hypothetical protein